MPKPPTPVPAPAEVLGRGRSAVVRADGVVGGVPTVRKAFVGDRLGRLVHELISGAPIPYRWSADAVRAAYLRRRILERLVPAWFGAQLRLPRTFDVAWSEVDRCWSLRTERIRGRHLPLRGPFSNPAADRLPELIRSVHRPLASRLEAWGFVGLVWQAGRGNPVAVGNFMLEEGEDGHERWVWIDLESGVPALFSPSPRAWWAFYLPWTIRLRRPLFDDVDTVRLRRAIAREAEADALLAWVDELEDVQARLQGLRRIERTLLAEVALGRLTAAAASHLRRHPAAALGWLVRRGAVSLGSAVAGAARRTVGWFRALDVGASLRALLRFTISQRYRAQLARTYLELRVGAWRRRAFLDEDEYARLIRDLEQDETSEYITDFGVHLLVKPFVKFVQLFVLPVLYLFGLAPDGLVILVLVAGGAIVRTLYTLVRFGQALLSGQRLPWTALALGALPSIGNAAWPAELVVSSTGDQRALARFLLQDVFAGIGRRIPIWGGPDTLTEHLLNRLPDRLWRRRRQDRSASS